MSELERLKRKAKKLYLKAQSFGHMSCGRNLAENIRPDIGVARQEFNRVWKKIEALDTNAPANPLC